MAEGELPTEDELREALDRVGVADILAERALSSRVDRLPARVAGGTRPRAGSARDRVAARARARCFARVAWTRRSSATSSRHERTSSSRTRRQCRRSLLPTTEIAAAREALAQAYLRTGDYDLVDRIVERAFEAARTSGDRRLEANALSVRGMTLHFRAIDLPPTERASIDPGSEETFFEQALALRRELGDMEGIAESLFQLGLVFQVLRRDLDAGAPFVHEALEVVATVPAADVLLRSEIHRHAGFDELLRRERRDEAREHLQASLALRESLVERGWRRRGTSRCRCASGSRVAARRQSSTPAGRWRSLGRRGFASASSSRRRMRWTKRRRSRATDTALSGRVLSALVIHNPPRRGDSALTL